ncbi:uncharacterized protein [Onthophagus taurus]|uniref:uncharacterized protein n=1 Tax=Onthophagus taurus TaxID=166361 RepID=UPI000C209E5C|nr:uncharacterized protein LOC111413517 [Onthophagus taurus]
MLSKAELVGALCTVLAFVSAGQILITGILSFEFPHFLAFSHCHLSTAAGVISGLVAVPMVIQLKTAQISHHIELKYGYTKWYQVLAICVCAILHFAAAIFTAIGLLVPRKWEEEFFQKMVLYNEKNCAKSLVDNIQWALQCCGAQSYKDWNLVPWKKISDTRISRHFAFPHPRESPSLVNAVPFSCCARKVLDVCLHYNLLEYGVKTISIEGCAPKVQKTSNFILAIEFGMFSLCIIIESVVLLCLLKDRDPMEEIQKNELLKKYLFKTKKVPSIDQRKKSDGVEAEKN